MPYSAGKLISLGQTVSSCTARTHPNSPVAGRTVRTAPGAISHDRLHRSIGMLDRLRPVRVGDKLLRLRCTVGMVDLLSRRVASLDGLRGNVPLRNARGELHKVVLPAGTVPLRDPARGERGRTIGRAVGVGRSGPCHR